MSGGAVRWTTGTLLALLGLAAAGCGGSADASADASAKAESASTAATTTTVVGTTTTSVPPPYSFDGSVPPPKLVNTGTDYAAIVKSLLEYVSWLKAHHPDVDLLENAVVLGSSLHDRATNDLRVLQKSNLRLVEKRDRIDVEPVSVFATDASVRVIEHIGSEDLVMKDGSVSDTRTFDEPLHWNAIIKADRGRWRLASVELAEETDSVEVDG